MFSKVLASHHCPLSSSGEFNGGMSDEESWKVSSSAGVRISNQIRMEPLFTVSSENSQLYSGQVYWNSAWKSTFRRYGGLRFGNGSTRGNYWTKSQRLSAETLRSSIHIISDHSRLSQETSKKTICGCET